MNKQKRTRCEVRREKPSRYLSAKNTDGRSYRKCGRIAVSFVAGHKPMCAQCARLYLTPAKPTEGRT